MIEIEIEGLDEAIRLLDAFPETVKTQVAATLATAAYETEAEAKRLAAVDTGGMRSAIRARQVGPLEWEVRSPRPGVYVEFGTRPHFPPLAPITAWARRHGIEKAAFAIARKISRVGTRAQPFMRPALEKVMPRIRQMIDQIARGAR
jgi:HK97 gp10 family phage protein